MSGYALQISAILIVNIVAAYSAYMPLACGQLNLGIAGFMAIGAYTSAVLSGHGYPLFLSMIGGAFCSNFSGPCDLLSCLAGEGHLPDDCYAGVFRSGCSSTVEPQPIRSGKWSG